MQSKHPNELHRNFLGVVGLNPWVGHDSSARQQMMSSHLSQCLVVSGATERRCQTGMEREYGKYTFNIKFPCDAHIIKVIERYPYKIGPDAIAFNPQTVVIYEDARTKEVGYVNVTKYCSNHPYFGFEYQPREGLSDIRSGAFIPEGTVLMESPSVTKHGGYKYGIECNMAFMSHPAVSEDGILISRDVLDKFSFKTYETRVVDWGSKRFPLNLYGDENNYKPFPDIGDLIRPDGLLMCLRPYDTELAVVEQNIHALREPDFTFDKCTYAAGEGGRVVDIRIQHDIYNAQPGGAGGIDAQPEKYDNARRQFYQEIVNEYRRLKKTRGDNLQLSKDFHRLIVEALAVIDNDPQKIIKLHRQAPLDDWRVEFVIEYNITPTIGFKQTGLHGNKGVICHIAEPHEMPVDEDGNRADIVMDPYSVVSRMNLGCLYEQYINAASRDVAKKVRSILGFVQTDRDVLNKLRKMEVEDPTTINKAWQYLVGYYSIVSPKQGIWMTDGQYQGSMAEHLATVVKDGVYLYVPPDNEPESERIVQELEKYYRPTYGPVSYIGNSGKRVVTKRPVRIGSMYIVLLEKIADDWTAVSSGKLQHFGVLSQVTNTDKYGQPSRQQAIRALGESEVRIYASYAGAKVTADILDRNNNPATHRQILESILSADQPTNIVSAVDRSKIPLGGARPLSLVKHILLCSGAKFVYRPHAPWKGNRID